MKPEPEHPALAALTERVGHFRLVFRWPQRTSSLLLPLLFILSVAVHGVAFYIFQVQYPPTIVSAPPPAQVTLLTGETPQGAALLKWIETRDPATAAGVVRAAAPPLEELRYEPSYAKAQTQPLEPEPDLAPVAIPPAHTLLDWTAAREKATAREPSRRVISHLRFSESLRGRDAAPGAPLGLEARSSANLHRSVFLTAVSDRGEVRYCFLQEQSGDPAMDSQAEHLLRDHPFTHADGGPALEWGYSVFTWGAEAYAPAPSPTPTGTPGT